MTEQRTGEMEPGHDHRTGVICHLPEELSARPTGKGVYSQVLKVNYIVSSASVLLLWLRQTCFFVIKSQGFSLVRGIFCLQFCILFNAVSMEEYQMRISV